MNFNKNDRVRYIGSNHLYQGKHGTVVTCQRCPESGMVLVIWDGATIAVWHVVGNLHSLMPIGGVTTTKKEVVMPDTCGSRGAGLKFDGGKEQPRLLHQGVPLALAEVVRTLTFGAKKYAADSWQNVEKAEERYQDASYRHDAARCRGETHDPETTIRHRAHHIINELFLLELELRKEKESGSK